MSTLIGQVARREPEPLSNLMRAGTRLLHSKAERTGVVGKLLEHRCDRREYALFLRNLLPVYETLERTLDAFRDARPAIGVARVARPEVYRAAALRSDLLALCGVTWQQALPLLPTAESYAEAIATATRRRGDAGLLAHAYVRYLGDLSGGQLLRTLIARDLSIDAHCLTVYDFPAIPDVARFRQDYRQAIDQAGIEISAAQAAVAEAVDAFAYSIALSEAVANAGY